MELVEGEDLSHRIPKGVIPIDEALRIAKQIAEALESAHDRGIIHRDLKPANIKLRPDGTVKVLDFGLAKAIEPTSGSSPSVSQSPTITTPAMTQAGMILGTAAYMSPEQAKGRAADKRSDVWAFGCVLYEMLTGTRAFRGDDVSDTLAAILRGEPNWTTLPAHTPLPVRRLLRRCLAKDRTRRLDSASDARLEIEDGLTGAPEESAIITAALPVWRRVLPSVLGVLVVGSLLAVLVLRTLPVPVRGPSRFVITTSSDAPFAPTGQPDVAISPDGSTVVYQGDDRTIGRPIAGHLSVREIDRLEAVPLQGTEYAMGPEFSRDGAWVVYWDSRNGTLKRISPRGGPPVTICTVKGRLSGASWAPDDTIVFATDESKGLMRVPAGGGTPERLTSVDPGKGERDHFWPDVLPDGRAVLFTAWNGAVERARVAVVSLPSGQVSGLLDGTSAHFSRSGHLVFAAADRTLRAVGFDVGRLQVIGNPVTIVENVSTWPNGNADFAIAGAGSLVYATGTIRVTPPRTLVWVDRKGHEEPINVPPRAYFTPRLSPDESRVALAIRDKQTDIYILELARPNLQRLTNEQAGDLDPRPVWTPDGKRVAFDAERDGVHNIYWQAFDGSGAIERLSTDARGQVPLSFSRDGTQLMFRTPHIGIPFDLGVITLGPPHTETTLFHTTASENNGEISPNGRWLAYDSDESGQFEVWVRPFPDVDRRRHKVSVGGGSRPLWSRNGSELFYTTVAPDMIMSVPVQFGADVMFGSPRPVVKWPNVDGGRAYDVSADGQRFLLLKDAPTAAGQKSALPEIHLVINWFEELKRLVPTNYGSRDPLRVSHPNDLSRSVAQ
jgi:serine/threonine-protein kinase